MHITREYKVEEISSDSGQSARCCTTRRVMTVCKALVLSMLLSIGAQGLLGEYREVSSSDEDLEDVLPSRSRVSSEGGEERSEHHHKHHAHSFQHFHGPVEGHHQEVSWKDKHGHHHHDFKAHPEYKFHYGVEDHHTKDLHGQKEHRNGKELHGEYHIHEPGGNIRTVKYFSDHHGGFFAEVENHGGNDHSGGTYGGHGKH